MDLPMAEVETSDALAFINRMGRRELGGYYYKNWDEKPKMAGTESFVKLIKFVRMTFSEYAWQHQQWHNPFQYIKPPKDIEYQERDSLLDDEVLKLFEPGVLNDSMEVAVCAAMFLAGLRRGEVFALKPEDLNWQNQRITVCRAWQNFTYKSRVMGPTKSKRTRRLYFDKFLQGAIKKLWEENGQHDFVFAFPDGTTPGPSWIKGRLKKWIARAEIELNDRNITPHSSRHSIATILIDRGVPLKHVQDFLGHLTYKTTRKYLHTTEKTLRDIGSKMDTFIEGPQEEQQEEKKILKIG